LVRHLKVTVDLNEKWYGENEGLQWPDVEPVGNLPWPGIEPTGCAVRCKNCGEVSTDAELIQREGFPGGRSVKEDMSSF
jgi:hypothetical protein